MYVGVCACMCVCVCVSEREALILCSDNTILTTNSESGEGRNVMFGSKILELVVLFLFRARQNKEH